MTLGSHFILMVFLILVAVGMFLSAIVIFFRFVPREKSFKSFASHVIFGLFGSLLGFVIAYVFGAYHPFLSTRIFVLLCGFLFILGFHVYKQKY